MNFIEFKNERNAVTPLVKTERTFGSGQRVRLVGRDYAVIADDGCRVVQSVDVAGMSESATVRVVQVRPAEQHRHIGTVVVFEWPSPASGGETRNGKPPVNEGPSGKRAGRAAVAG